MTPQGTENTSAFCEYCGSPLDVDNKPYQLRPGTVIAKRYIIGSVLGAGGFGITYIGWDSRLSTRIAIKEYFPVGYVDRRADDGSDITVTAGNETPVFERQKRRFVEEAKILAKFLNDPAIVSVIDIITENNTAYTVMHLISGTTLAQYLKENDRPDFVTAYAMLRPIMEALIRVHAAGLIHRDLSPSNIMVQKDSSLILLDFGSAREYDNESEKSMSVILKPGYAPSEQYVSHGAQGPWTDVYSICATLYRMITGVTPPNSLMRMGADTLRSPSELGADITPEQEAALLKGLSVTKDGRYLSMDELIEALDAPAEGYYEPFSPSVDISAPCRSEHDPVEADTYDTSPDDGSVPTQYIYNNTLGAVSPYETPGIPEENVYPECSDPGYDTFPDYETEPEYDPEPGYEQGTADEPEEASFIAQPPHSQNHEKRKRSSTVPFIALAILAACVIIIAAVLLRQDRSYENDANTGDITSTSDKNTSVTTTDINSRTADTGSNDTGETAAAVSPAKKEAGAAGAPASEPVSSGGSGSWKSAYMEKIDLFEQDSSDYTTEKYALAYIDDDTVPELIMGVKENGAVVPGMGIYTFSEDEAICSVPTGDCRRFRIFYQKGTGLVNIFTENNAINSYEISHGKGNNYRYTEPADIMAELNEAFTRYDTPIYMTYDQVKALLSASDWKSSYLNEIGQFEKDSAEYSGYDKYALIFIDENDVPELCMEIPAGMYSGPGTGVYTYSHGNVSQLVSTSQEDVRNFIHTIYCQISRGRFCINISGTEGSSWFGLNMSDGQLTYHAPIEPDFDYSTYHYEGYTIPTYITYDQIKALLSDQGH